LQKTLSLKELPHTFISSGMTLPELCTYLGVAEELIMEWERFFNLFPEKEAQGGNQKEKVYSQKRIRDFIKIKDGIDRRKYLKLILSLKKIHLKIIRMLLNLNLKKRKQFRLLMRTL